MYFFLIFVLFLVLGICNHHHRLFALVLLKRNSCWLVVTLGGRSGGRIFSVASLCRVLWQAAAAPRQLTRTTQVVAAAAAAAQILASSRPRSLAAGPKSACAINSGDHAGVSPFVSQCRTAGPAGMSQPQPNEPPGDCRCRGVRAELHVRRRFKTLPPIYNNNMQDTGP